MHFAHKNFEYFLYGLNAAESPQRDFMSFVTRIQFTQPKLFPEPLVADTGTMQCIHGSMMFTEL
jgi:hypothetical protein